MSYAVQHRDSPERNRLYHDDVGIHDWYRFILSYPPHLVRNYLHKFQLNHAHTVLDPFCGTGTTLIESRKLEIPSIGIEANPVVRMAAGTKLNWNVDCKALLEHALRICHETRKRLKQYADRLKTLSPEQEKLIIRHSISPLPLHKSLVLLEVINDMHDSRFHDIERTAFSKQLVSSYSNLQFGPEVGVSRRRKNDPPVVEPWLSQIRTMAADLRKHAAQKNVPSKVHLGDARAVEDILQEQSVDAVITSPPYPNEKDYTRTTRLESVLLGFINTKADLRANKQHLLRSNTRNIYKGDDDEQWVAKHPQITKLADSIEDKRITLGKTSGFERTYHKVVKHYFGGMARHLEQLKHILRPGARLAYVVGEQASYFRIPIRTGRLLSGIAENLGYEPMGTDLFRTRFSTATKEQLREEVVLLRWN